MSNFPLYNSLLTDLPEKDLTSAQKRDFLKKIPTIDEEGHELTYALIKMHQIKSHDNSLSHNLPYNGKNDGEGFNFDIENFPIDLRQILYKFIKMHIKKMKEESSITNSRTK